MRRTSDVKRKNNFVLATRTDNVTKDSYDVLVIGWMVVVDPTVYSLVLFSLWKWTLNPQWFPEHCLLILCWLSGVSWTTDDVVPYSIIRFLHSFTWFWVFRRIEDLFADSKLAHVYHIWTLGDVWEKWPLVEASVCTGIILLIFVVLFGLIAMTLMMYIWCRCKVIQCACLTNLLLR